MIPLRAGNRSTHQNVGIGDAPDTDMLTTASLFLLFLQSGGAAALPGGHPNGICVSLGCVDVPVAEAGPREAQYEEQEFYRRFNSLATALTDFSRTYNSRGVIDVKKIKAIRKALREFEKSTWFRQKAE